MTTWLPTLKTAPPDNGHGVAVKMARVAIKMTISRSAVRRCQGSTTLVAHEQWPSKLLLEQFGTCTDSRLADIEPLRSRNEAAGRNDL